MEAPILVKSLGLDWSGFIKIDNSPSLMLSTVISKDSDSLSFFILGTSNIKYFTILPIDELVVLILEYLEPARVGGPDLHVVSSTCRLDIPGLVVESSSDSQRWLMEVPDLSLSSILNLNDHVSVVDQIEISIAWQFGDNVEVSFNVESKPFIEFSLDWLTLPFINIDDIKLLVDFAMFWMDNDISVLCINSSSDVEYFAILDVTYESSFKLE
jgi:hypothetical protein